MPAPETGKPGKAQEKMRGLVENAVSILDSKKRPSAEFEPDNMIEGAAVRTTLQRNRSYGDIDIDLIEPDPDQVRVVQTQGEEFDGFVASVREHGVLQPIIVRHLEGQPKPYQIVAGERRYQAALRAGLATIPAIVREVDDTDKAVQQLVENLQRKDLNAIEEAKAFRRYLSVTGKTQEQLAHKIGKSKSYVSQVVGMLEKLSREEQDAIAKVQGPKPLGVSLIFEAMRIPDPAVRLAILRGEMKWDQAREHTKGASRGDRPKGFGRRYSLAKQNATVTVTFKKSKASEYEVGQALLEAYQEHKQRARREVT